MADRRISTDWNLGAARDARLRRLHDYWLGKRDGRALPTRADIDPVELRLLLAYVFLVDVIAGRPRDYRFRLAGTHIRDFAGMEVTGKRIPEVFPPAFGDEVRQHWDAAIACAAPLHCQGRLWTEDAAHLPWEGIVMPLGGPGGGVAMLFGGFVVEGR